MNDNDTTSTGTGAGTGTIPVPYLIGCVVTGVCTVAFYYYYYCYNYYRYKDKKDNSNCVIKTVGYVKGISMIESIRQFGGPNAPLFLLQLARRSIVENNCSSYRLPIPMSGGLYIVNDPKIIRLILIDPTTDKSSTYKSISIINGAPDSIVSSSSYSTYWKSVRKLIAPAFATIEIERMRHIAEVTITNWCQNKGRTTFITTPFDPSIEMVIITFKIICQAAFEYTPSSNDNDDDEFYQFTIHLHRVMKEIYIKQAINPLRSLFSYIIPEVRQAMSSCTKVQEYGKKILYAYYNNRNKSTQSTTVIRLIATNTELSEKQKIAEILVFLVAGHDTVGYTIATTLVLLAQHPHCLQKLYNDTKHIVPQLWSKNSLYYQAIVKESFRYLPAPGIGSSRILGKDYNITVTTTPETTINPESTTTNNVIVQQRKLPKGCTVFLPQVVPGRLESIFTNPDEFNPDRWLLDNTTNNNNENNDPVSSSSSTTTTSTTNLQEMNDAIIPYSVGIRNCIGQALATAEIDTILPILLSQFNLQLISPGTLDFFVTWKIKDSKLLLIQR